MESILKLSVFVSILVVASAQEFEAVCNDCWCVVEDGDTSASTCPEYPSELFTAENIDSTWAETLSSFQMTNGPLKLVNPETNSNECYPFFTSIGPFPRVPESTSMSRYFESNFTQCVLMPAQPVLNDPVCVYKFTGPAGEMCMGREYELLTVEADSVDDTMLVVHTGTCGVCSTAQDVSVRFAAILSFRSAVTQRATSYALSADTAGRFNTLVNSLDDEPVNLSTECARLWAHFGATNAQACSHVCITDPGTNQIPVVMPGSCEESDCLACGKSFTTQFDELAGITSHTANAGFRTDFPVPCSNFLVHTLEPCRGAVSPNSPQPTAAPATTSEAVRFDWITSLAVLVSIFLCCST